MQALLSAPLPLAPMRLAYRTVSFRNMALGEALLQIASIGYDGVEICMEYHQLAQRAGRGELSSILADAEAEGLAVASLSDHRSLLNDRSFRNVLEEVERASEVEVPVFIVSSGPRGEGTGLSELVGRVDALLDASEGETKVALEPEPGLVIEGSEGFAELKSKLRLGDDLYMNLDIGHAYCLSEDLEQLLRRFSREIAHFHIEDISSRVHKHLVPGEGDMDFARALDQVERWHSDKFVAIDLFDVPDPVSAAQRAMDVLGPIAKTTRHR